MRPVGLSGISQAQRDSTATPERCSFDHEGICAHHYGGDAKICLVVLGRDFVVPLRDLRSKLSRAFTHTHVIEFRASGWTLQHPLMCRADMFKCPFNRAAEEHAGDAFAELGAGKFFWDTTVGLDDWTDLLPCPAEYDDPVAMLREELP